MLAVDVDVHGIGQFLGSLVESREDLQSVDVDLLADPVDVVVAGDLVDQGVLEVLVDLLGVEDELVILCAFQQAAQNLHCFGLGAHVDVVVG